MRVINHSYLGHLARMLLCFSVACALVFGLIHPAVRHAVNVWDGGEWGRIHVAEQREKKRLQDLAMRPG